jgi:hypothetical protein
MSLQNMRRGQIYILHLILYNVTFISVKLSPLCGEILRDENVLLYVGSWAFCVGV